MITAIWLIGSAGIGVIAACLIGRLMRGNGLGLVGDIIAGVLGAVLLGYVLRVGGLDLGGALLGPLIASSAGAAIVLFLVHVLTGRRTAHRLSS